MIHVYGCGTPIRMHVARAMATYLKAPLHEESNPNYVEGDSVVWGLIRGAPEVISETKKAKHHYYQLDNGYFGRNKYYRFTWNAFQQTELKDRPADRWEHIRKQENIKIQPWKKTGSHVVFCLSTEWLYKFFKQDINHYRDRVITELKGATDRKIIVREKNSVGPIEDVLKDAWCLVTHTSACGLDALRMGVPVFTTGECAAKPCALQDLSLVESPIYPDREPLFRSLAYSQWLPEEMQLGKAWEDLKET